MVLDPLVDLCGLLILRPRHFLLSGPLESLLVEDDERSRQLHDCHDRGRDWPLTEVLLPRPDVDSEGVEGPLVGVVGGLVVVLEGGAAREEHVVGDV